MQLDGKEENIADQKKLLYIIDSMREDLEFERSQNMKLIKENAQKGL